MFEAKFNGFLIVHSWQYATYSVKQTLASAISFTKKLMDSISDYTRKEDCSANPRSIVWTKDDTKNRWTFGTTGETVEVLQCHIHATEEQM